MKRFLKLKNLIINNKELLLGIIVGLMMSSTAVFAVIKYASNNVLYRNTSSHLNATNVQAAIDELYTTCTSRPYTLIADSKGGTIPTTSGWSISGSIATKTVIFNGTYGTLPEPTKSGYTFVGWFTKDSGGTQVTSSTKYRIAGNSTIYAHWGANTYTVSFNANGGSGGQSANVTATYGSAMPAISTTAPTRSGFTFEGWYDTEASTGGTQYYTAAGASARSWDKTTNTTLYARWTANTYTVSFNANGGSGGQSANVTATYGSAMPTISTTAPTRSGYTFGGWYDTDASTGGTQYYTAAGASARSWDKTTNTTLYARWIANTYTVSFNANGGSGGQSTSVTATYGSAMPAISTTAPTNAGYTFGGWYDTDASTGGTQYYTATGASARSWDKTTNTTLYARWTANELTFNSQTLSSGTYGTAYTSNAFTGASNGTGNYTYTISNGAPTGATINSTNRTISFTSSTNAGTYNVVVTATDNNSGKTKDATMTIVINPQTLTCPDSPSAKSFTGSLLSSGITCPTGSTAGGTQSATNRGTYQQTCTADSNHQFASTCSVNWTIKCNTTITAESGGITAGNTVTYAGKLWTVVSTSGNNVNLAYNGVVRDSNNQLVTGTYAQAVTKVATWLNSNTITKDSLAAQCIVNNGSSSGIYTGVTDYNYYTGEDRFYNMAVRNKYSPVNHYYVTAYHTYRGDGKYDKFAEDYKVQVPSGEPTSVQILGIGIKPTTPASGTNYSLNNGVITFVNGKKGERTLFKETIYYSRHFSSFMWYPSFSSGINCTAGTNNMCYRKYTRIMNDNGTYSLVDWTENPAEVGNTWRQNMYLCGGESYGKKIVFQAKNSNYFYYANQASGTGWSGSSFSTENAIEYPYVNDQGRLSLHLASYDYTDESLGNATMQSNGFLYRIYRFDTHTDNNGDAYCHKVYKWEPEKLEITLRYRPYITVVRS